MQVSPLWLVEKALQQIIQKAPAERRGLYAVLVQVQQSIAGRILKKRLLVFPVKPGAKGQVLKMLGEEGVLATLAGGISEDARDYSAGVFFMVADAMESLVIRSVYASMAELHAADPEFQ